MNTRKNKSELEKIELLADLARAEKDIKNKWPANYHKLFGSISNKDLETIQKLKFKNDAKRKSL